MRKTILLLVATLGLTQASAQESDDLVFQAGHPSLQHWLMPETVPHPENNTPTPERIQLGQMLFFEKRLSKDGDMSCGTCHDPAKGWSDGLPTARGFRGMILGRATPTVINSAYNGIQMWDGREPTLESQAIGPMMASVEMNSDFESVFKFLNSNADYVQAFAKAYPGEAIGKETLQKAIASFERTIVSKNSPFDRWIKGEPSALSDDQVEGFKLFIGKAKCATCHAAPNFTDDGFHNLGLASFGASESDLGRYAKVPLSIMKGAFKTPTLRDISATAPYFHDGSAATLEEVMDHYLSGGVVTSNLSPNLHKIELTEEETSQVISFLHGLSSPSILISAP